MEALLAAVDRGSPKGKRDYAILLLACRLGLRVSDIVGLRLEHLHWREDRIEMAQAKTGAPLVLPLNEEVGEALIDYLQHGRPVTHHREVFLRLKAPVEPFSRYDNLHQILTFYRQRAGIALPAQARKGLHSLRHTVATPLARGGDPSGDHRGDPGAPFAAIDPDLRQGRYRGLAPCRAGPGGAP